MKTENSIRREGCPKTVVGCLGRACAARLLSPLLLLLLALPVTVQAQDYTYTITNGAITITKYTGSGGAVTIPDTINGLPVTTIGGYYNGSGYWSGAFDSCTSLTSVTIPNSVTSIGDWAFSSCTRLTGVTIPDSVTNIGWRAFQECHGLTSVTMGNSVISIGHSAFEGCTSLTNINCPSSVTSIGPGAFMGCTSLASVTIPNSVTSIGEFAFTSCASLTAITVDAFNPVYTSVDGVLFNQSLTTLVEYPGGIAGSYTIPNSVTNIWDGAFYDCVRLTSVTIPNSVTSIGDYAFYDCTSLTNVTIGTNVTSIGDWAFAFYTSLTSVTIPNSVTNIGDEAFADCTSLTAITVDAYNSFYTSADGVLFDKGQTTLIQYPSGKAGSYTVPNSVTSIGGGAFHGCGSLTSVTIPNSVTSIGDVEFSWCSSLTAVYFVGNAPSFGLFGFWGYDNATVYYLAGTMGWSTTFGGRPTALWHLPTPVIVDFGPSFGVQTNLFGFIISWATNVPVVVEACTDLANPTWSPVATNTLSGGSSYFSDADWTNYPIRFYRLRSP